MPRAVAVAVSGGRDSTALLHVTARAAVALDLQVHALHVHHGLVAEADAWLRQVQAQCRRWAQRGLPVHFHATRLDEKPARGDSIEAWARRQRYRALGEMARDAGCDLVLLAHHRRDQGETLLLQALRGGGPAGLAAMPREAVRDGVTWARPWLALPREAIEAYVARHRLRYVDDGSNDDPRFARNRLRRLWPALQRAFPDAEPQLQAAAARAAEGSAVLGEVAALDAAACVDGDALRLPPWRTLSRARRTLLLRHWLHDAPESLVQRLAAELPTAAQGARWPAPGGELRLYDDGLQRHHEPAAVALTVVASAIDLSAAGHHEAAGWHGAFVVEAVTAGGIEPSRLRQARLRVREGGEDFQAAPGAVARSLKKQFQGRRVPAWQRGGPLVFDGAGLLLFVPGLGVDARALAPAGASQLALSWVPAG